MQAQSATLTIAQAFNLAYSYWQVLPPHGWIVPNQHLKQLTVMSRLRTSGDGGESGDAGRSAVVIDGAGRGRGSRAGPPLRTTKISGQRTRRKVKLKAKKKLQRQKRRRAGKGARRGPGLGWGRRF